MHPVLLFLLVGACPAWAVLRLQNVGFMKLPLASGQPAGFSSGTGDKADYDPQEHFLYVIGYKADVLHVVNMTDPENPILMTSKEFGNNEGRPDAIKVCRFHNREFLVVAFEAQSEQQESVGLVIFYKLLTSSTVTGSLETVFAKEALNSFDPKGLAAKTDCSEFLVISEGDPHEIQGNFEDPNADIEVLVPGATSISRTTVPVVEANLVSAGVRKVFTNCDSVDEGYEMPSASDRKQDLEPKAVRIDKNGMAYIIFQENNAIATFDMSIYTGRSLNYHDLGSKDWTNIAFDGAYMDNAVHLRERHGLQSLYQPGDLAVFEMDNKMWLATADQGSIRQYNFPSCRFDESVQAMNFAHAMSPSLSGLNDSMRDRTEIGDLLVSRLLIPNDGWDGIWNRYNSITAFGGRGFSIWDPDNISNGPSYNSGDEFERYFVEASYGAQDREKAMFNAKVGDPTSGMPSLKDRASVDMGPTPSRIVAAEWDSSTQALVISNGVYGGLYVYSVTSGPTVAFQSYTLRGNHQYTWEHAYNLEGDEVGEPAITDMLTITSNNQIYVVAVSSKAGALGFYKLIDA